ncbi:MAG: sigma-70 family RNA polymerase sigma factor [Paludibacteraceae bacterium]|nr:sigma-70 family RNA polymerase sigma factor [Paludibacteraceae bacterium]MBN2787931.1 sigma-70 family RNA polymerase sigma factor [Paludibacteraceae bacterium]
MTKEEFKYLFDSYFNAVRSYLFYRGVGADEASDLAQDVFLRLWEKQIEVDPKTAIHLLYKIAGDMSISKYRRKTLEINYLNSLTSNKNAVSPEDEIEYKELFTKYQKALAKLTEKQRSVFLMSRIEGLKYHEIAERLNLSEKAVEKRMSSTLTFLKKVLQ